MRQLRRGTFWKKRALHSFDKSGNESEKPSDVWLGGHGSNPAYYYYTKLHKIKQYIIHGSPFGSTPSLIVLNH